MCIRTYVCIIIYCPVLLSWVKEFLNEQNQGLQILVQFLLFRFKVDKELR